MKKNIYQITRKNFMKYNYVRCIVIAEDEDYALYKAHPVLGLDHEDIKIIKLGSTNIIGVGSGVICTELNSK